MLKHAEKTAKKFDMNGIGVQSFAMILTIESADKSSRSCIIELSIYQVNSAQYSLYITLCSSKTRLQFSDGQSLFREKQIFSKCPAHLAKF